MRSVGVGVLRWLLKSGEAAGLHRSGVSLRWVKYRAAFIMSQQVYLYFIDLPLPGVLAWRSAVDEALPADAG